MSEKEKKVEIFNKENVWPEDVRLKMIEHSEFYNPPDIYHYGYYDGYQLLRTETLQLQNNLDNQKAISSELVEALKIIERLVNPVTREATIVEFKISTIIEEALSKHSK